jgi:hypothetical protein
MRFGIIERESDLPKSLFSSYSGTSGGHFKKKTIPPTETAPPKAGLIRGVGERFVEGVTSLPVAGFAPV